MEKVYKLTKKYNAFRREVKKSLGVVKKKKHKEISEAEFEHFIRSILSKTDLFLKDTIYCRYGVSRIEIDQGNPAVDKTIAETDIKKHDISVLILERGSKAIPNPPPDTKILSGDQLVCFGKLQEMRKKIYTVRESGDQKIR